MSVSEERKKLEDAIHSLEDLKTSGLMPAEQADASIAALRKQLVTYQADVEGGGSIAQGQSSIAAGEGSTV